MSQMNIDATVDQLGDDFDVQGAATSRKKGFIGLAAAIAIAAGGYGAYYYFIG